MMQAPAMMPAGVPWMAYTDRDGRPCWHNPATNEWTYNLGGAGAGVMMSVPQPQVVGYVPAPAAPVGYTWQVAAPAATVPAPGPVFYGPPGAAVMPAAAAAPYAPQQMVYAQQMQQQQQQQGMMAAAAYQQQQQQQLQLQRSGSDGGMFGGHPSMVGAAGVGLAGYAMMPDPNGPDAAAWFGPGPPDGSMPFPKSHTARGWKLCLMTLSLETPTVDG
eukprot:g11822.t1